VEKEKMKILKMWVFRSRKSKNDILPWPNEKKRERANNNNDNKKTPTAIRIPT
jgi:hypothetical protein